MINRSLSIQDDLNPTLKSQYVFKEKSSSHIDLQVIQDNVGIPQTSKLIFLSVECLENLNGRESQFNTCSLSQPETGNGLIDGVNLNDSIKDLPDVICSLPQDKEDNQNSVIILPGTKNNAHSISLVVNDSLVPNQIIQDDNNGSLNDNEKVNMGFPQFIIHPQSSRFSSQSNPDKNSYVLTQKLILMSCIDDVTKKDVQYDCEPYMDHHKSDDIINGNNINLFNNNDNSVNDYNTQCNEENNHGDVDYHKGKENKIIDTRLNGSVLLKVDDASQDQLCLIRHSTGSDPLDDIITLGEIHEKQSKVLLNQIKYSTKDDVDDDHVNVNVNVNGNDLHCTDNRENDHSQDQDTFLSSSNQDNKVLMKPEDFMNVETYTLDHAEFSTGDDTACYSSVDVSSAMDKVENEFLTANAIGFEETDAGLLPSSLAMFTTQEPDGGEFLTCGKIRMIENKINATDTIAFDYLCNRCELGMKCGRHDVEGSDKAVVSRARATLPKDLLTINLLKGSTNEEGVFARKTIMKRVQFGPVEGRLVKTWAQNDKFRTNELELLLEDETGHLVKLDVSNERDTNWMRFVRRAKTLKEQNLILIQKGKSLYFVSTRVIPPRQELKVGYSPQYAKRRKLIALEDLTWNGFQTLQNSSINGYEKKMGENLGKAKVASGNEEVSFRETNDPTVFSKSEEKKENKCWTCHKVFPRSYSLKRHMHAVHSGKNKENSSLMKNQNDEPEKKSMANTLFKKKPSTGPKSEWLCTHCNLTFNNSSVLNLHTLTHAAEDLESEAVLGLSPDLTSVYNEGEFFIESSQVQCPQCTREFSSKRELIDHVASHGKVTLKRLCGNSANVYKCDRCYKSFATDIRLKRHMFVHGSEDIKPFQCGVCLKRFLNNSALSCHLKTHNEKKFFDCPICKKEFKQVFGLKEHIKIHSSDGFFTCPHCSKVFEGYSVVRKHIRAFHSGHQHKCEECGKLCLTLDKLRMHALKHSDHREFLCANCGKQFKRKDKLKEHMKRMHSAEREMKTSSFKVPNTKDKSFTPKMSPATYDRFIYKCRICMVGFKRRGMLVNHLAKRHPDVVPDTVPELNLPILKVTTDYFCQYCDKIYKSSSKRKAHILKNHPGAELPMSKKGEKGHVMGVSDSTFSQTVGSVKTSPHGCKWCHKQYASKAKLLQHQRKKHMSLLPQSQQVPRPAKNSNSPKNERTTDKAVAVAPSVSAAATSSASIFKQVFNQNEINESFRTKHSDELIFPEEGKLKDNVVGVATHSLRKNVKENMQCDLLREDMIELGQALPEYKLPHETLLKMMAAAVTAKDGDADASQVNEHGVAVEPGRARTWSNLPPCPPR